MEGADEEEPGAATPPWAARERGDGKSSGWRSKLKAEWKGATGAAKSTLGQLRSAFPQAVKDTKALVKEGVKQLKESVNGGSSPARETEAPLPPGLSLAQLLSQPHCDLRLLRRYVAVMGCEDNAQPGLRIAAWRLLLGVAPLELSARDAEALARRANYARLVQELIVEPCSLQEGGASGEAAQAEAAVRELAAVAVSADHPLAVSEDSVWHRHFRDAELRDQIARDVERTQRNIHFFSSDTQGGEAHRGAQCRALFVFAATNKGVRYVQGMNELLAPLYFLCATAPGKDGQPPGSPASPPPADPSPPPPPQPQPPSPPQPADEAAEPAAEPAGPADEPASPQAPPSPPPSPVAAAVCAPSSPPPLGEPTDAEADAFHCFVPLLSELRDLFCATFDGDGSGEGVAGTLGRLSALLRWQDEPLWKHLEGALNVNPQFYAFRWVTTAFTQEFLLPDTLRLWDFLFSAPDGPREALLRVAAAMVIQQRGFIMSNDFAATLKMLQSYPPTDVLSIVRRAQTLPAAPPAQKAKGAGDDVVEEEGWDRMKALRAAAAAAAAWRGGAASPPPAQAGSAGGAAASPQRGDEEELTLLSGRAEEAEAEEGREEGRGGESPALVMEPVSPLLE